MVRARAGVAVLALAAAGVVGLLAGLSPAARAAGSGGAVAAIGSVAITQAEFDHWIVVANDANQAAAGAAAPPLPVPPDYAGCIAALRKQRTGQSDDALKAVCAQQYGSLSQEVMGFLIKSIWIEGEASARGIVVTRAEVDRSYEAQRRAARPSLDTVAELDAFLAKTGQTVRDLKWRTLVNLLANGLYLQIEARAKRVSAAQIAAYYDAHRSRYAGATLAQVAARIRTLISAARVASGERRITRRYQSFWRVHTACRAGLAVASYCGRETATVVADPTASYPGAVGLPPSLPQTRRYTPPPAAAPPPQPPTSTVPTPAGGPLSREPSVPPTSGPPPTTLRVIDLIAGTGAAAAIGDTITVNYVGALYGSGKVFDSSWSRSQTFATRLDPGSLIEGWAKGLVGMRVGGRRELIIPPALAYKDVAEAGIPANSTLVFVVDLLAVSH